MSVRIVNGLCVTESICFPRSGHQALLDVLADYFGSNLVYCEPYREPKRQIDLDPLTNYQKNHDLDWQTKIHDDRKYVVQVRDPLDAFSSRWEMDTRCGTVLDDEHTWRVSMANWSLYWHRFVTKWVFASVPNRLIVRYPDLLADPMECCGNVIQFMQGIGNLDVQRLRASLDRYPIKLKKRKPLRHCHCA